MLDKRQLPAVTISLGITGRQPGYSLDMMIAAADVAMYHAKRNGRNRVEVAANVSLDERASSFIITISALTDD